MKAEEIMESARDALSVKRVFGEPYERNGTTVIPAAFFRGGGGGGGDHNTEHGGSGAGFGLMGRPAGAYVVRDGVVSWQPALDINRIISTAGMAFIAMLFAWRSVARTRAKRKR